MAGDRGPVCQPGSDRSSGPALSPRRPECPPGSGEPAGAELSIPPGSRHWIPGPAPLDGQSGARAAAEGRASGRAAGSRPPGVTRGKAEQGRASGWGSSPGSGSCPAGPRIRIQSGPGSPRASPPAQRQAAASFQRPHKPTGRSPRPPDPRGGGPGWLPARPGLLTGVAWPVDRRG